MSALRRPVLGSQAVARQHAVITRLKQPAPPQPKTPARDPFVSALADRLDDLADPLEEALGQVVQASVAVTRHPPQSVCVAFDISGADEASDPLAVLYLDRSCLDRLVAVQCGARNAASRSGTAVTPFERAIATTVMRTLLGAGLRETDGWTLTPRTDPEPDIDAARDATVTLNAVSRGMVGDVLGSARIQLTPAGDALLSDGPTTEVGATGLAVTPIRLRATITVPNVPLATIRGLRVGQRLFVGPQATVALMSGRRRLAEGSVPAEGGTGPRRIAITALSNKGIAAS